MRKCIEVRININLKRCQVSLGATETIVKRPTGYQGLLHHKEESDLTTDIWKSLNHWYKGKTGQIAFQCNYFRNRVANMLEENKIGGHENNFIILS